jgi:hypothetical protein
MLDDYDFRDEVAVGERSDAFIPKVNKYASDEEKFPGLLQHALVTLLDRYEAEESLFSMIAKLGSFTHMNPYLLACVYFSEKNYISSIRAAFNLISSCNLTKDQFDATIIRYRRKLQNVLIEHEDGPPSDAFVVKKKKKCIKEPPISSLYLQTSTSIGTDEFNKMLYVLHHFILYSSTDVQTVTLSPAESFFGVYSDRDWRTIVYIGQSKQFLHNLLNFLFGVKFEDPFSFQLPPETNFNKCHIKVVKMGEFTNFVSLNIFVLGSVPVDGTKKKFLAQHFDSDISKYSICFENDDDASHFPDALGSFNISDLCTSSFSSKETFASNNDQFSIIIKELVVPGSTHFDMMDKKQQHFEQLLFDLVSRRNKDNEFYICQTLAIEYHVLRLQFKDIKLTYRNKESKDEMKKILKVNNVSDDIIHVCNGQFFVFLKKREKNYSLGEYVQYGPEVASASHHENDSLAQSSLVFTKCFQIINILYQKIHAADDKKLQVFPLQTQHKPSVFRFHKLVVVYNPLVCSAFYEMIQSEFGNCANAYSIGSHGNVSSPRMKHFASMRDFWIAWTKSREDTRGFVA